MTVRTGFHIVQPLEKRLSLIDLINRRAAATGSPRYAMATGDADYNGHALSLYWNDYRGYYVLDYHWGERVVLHRGEDFAAALKCAKREFARQGRGASLRIRPRECDEAICLADPEVASGSETEGAYYTCEKWRVDELSFAMATHTTHHLIQATDLEDYKQRSKR